MTLLCAYASSREIGDLALPRSLELGVGKSRAAASLARALARGEYGIVLVVGVAGAYAGSGLEVGDLCAVGTAVLADEGVAHERGFASLAELGFDEAVPAAWNESRTAAVVEVLGLDAPVVAATVSTCSGCDALAQERAERTSASIETMESAALAIACAGARVALVELRAISNLCGDRGRADWDLARAVARLERDVPRVLDSGVLDGA